MIFGQDWMEQAKCAGLGDDTFFDDLPMRNSRNTRNTRKHDEALEVITRAYCKQCPVISECLEWALANEHFGIWGGMSADERDVLTKRRNRRTPA